MRLKWIISLILLITGLQSCGQNIDGTLTGTYWSPDSSLLVEVYKEDLKMAMPGQGGDHSAIIVLKKSSGEILSQVDGNSTNQILHRSFHHVTWEMDKNMLSYAPARCIEWIDEESLDMELIKSKINQYFGYDSWQYYKNPEAFGDRYFVIGEFFGDPDYDYTLDLAVLVKDSSEVVKLLIYQAYNYNHPSDGISLIDLTDEYSWVGNFELVQAKKPIWSNWVDGRGADGRRDFKDVPSSEIIYLDYDALYLHAGEACGGSFIFWKDNKWNWRQQE